MTVVVPDVIGPEVMNLREDMREIALDHSVMIDLDHDHSVMIEVVMT